MIKHYPGAVSKESCFQLYQTVMKDMLSQEEFPAGISKYRDGLLGDNWGFFNYGPSNELLSQFQYLVIRDFGSQYRFTHNYTRVYFGKTHLNPHVDRNGLDVTLSLSVHSTLNHSWPLWVSESKNLMNEWHTADKNNIDFVAFKANSKGWDLNVGDAVCITKEHPHWRDEIEFNGEHMVQVFYHWKRVS